jgi:hypothetical protein
MRAIASVCGDVEATVVLRFVEYVTVVKIPEIW